MHPHSFQMQRVRNSPHRDIRATREKQYTHTNKSPVAPWSQRSRTRLCAFYRCRTETEAHQERHSCANFARVPASMSRTCERHQRAYSCNYSMRMLSARGPTYVCINNSRPAQARGLSSRCANDIHKHIVRQHRHSHLTEKNSCAICGGCRVYYSKLATYVYVHIMRMPNAHRNRCGGQIYYSEE